MKLIIEIGQKEINGVMDYSYSVAIKQISPEAIDFNFTTDGIIRDYSFIRRKVIETVLELNKVNITSEYFQKLLGEYEDYWYLREGDFRPEPVKGIFNGNGCCKKFIEEMKDLGNLFPTREEAAKASDDIRAYLRSKYGKHP